MIDIKCNKQWKKEITYAVLHSRGIRHKMSLVHIPVSEVVRVL